MRKITQDAIQAFTNRTNFKRGNTQVKTLFVQNQEEEGLMSFLLLHGNLIARSDLDGNLFICNCGYRTVTTKERLNGFPNVKIIQKNFQWFLNGKAWSGVETKVE